VGNTRECTACVNKAWYCRECFNYACDQAKLEEIDFMIKWCVSHAKEQQSLSDFMVDMSFYVCNRKEELKASEGDKRD